jgi:hypothetical protein
VGEVVEYRVRSRRSLRTISALALAVVLGAIVGLVTGADVLRGDLRTSLIVIGALAGPLCLDLASGRTTLDEDGITTRSLFGTRFVPWADFRGVDVVEQQGRSYGQWIYVWTLSGRRVKLKAPFKTDKRADTQFDDACARLKRRKRAYFRHHWRRPEPNRAEPERAPGEQGG